MKARAALGDSPLVAFVGTDDQAAARRFYAEVLGLDLLEETPVALVFNAAGVSLRVTTVPGLTPAPYTVLGWSVADIHASVRELISRGVAFSRYDGFEQDSAGVWRSPDGAQVAWFRDPSGNVLSLTQP